MYINYRTLFLFNQKLKEAICSFIAYIIPMDYSEVNSRAECYLSQTRFERRLKNNLMNSQSSQDFLHLMCI